MGSCHLRNGTFGKLPLEKCLWESTQHQQNIFKRFFLGNQLLIPSFKYNTPYYWGLFFPEKSFYKKVNKNFIFFSIKLKSCKLKNFFSYSQISFCILPTKKYKWYKLSHLFWNDHALYYFKIREPNIMNSER